VVELDDKYQQLLKNIIGYVIVSEFIKKNNLSENEKAFANAYSKQLLNLNECLLGKNKIVKKINLDIYN